MSTNNAATGKSKRYGKIYFRFRWDIWGIPNPSELCSFGKTGPLISEVTTLPGNNNNNFQSLPYLSGDMGNVQGVESPQSVDSTDYINVKTLLVQMQAAGQAVVETLKSHKTIMDRIVATTDPLEKSWVRDKGDDSKQRHCNQTILHSLETGGLLQIQTMLHSIQVLDSLIQTSVKQHFSDSVHQTLEETWQQTVQKRETFTPISIGGTNKDQVPTTGSEPNSPSPDGSAGSVDGTFQASRDNVLNLEQQIRETKDRLEEIDKQEQQSVRTYNEKLESVNKTLENIQIEKNHLANSVETNHQEIKELQCEVKQLKELLGNSDNLGQYTAVTTDVLRSQLLSTESLNNELLSQLSSKAYHIKSIEKDLQSLRNNLAEKNKICEKRESEIQVLTNRNRGLQNALHDAQQENSRLNEQLNKTHRVELQVWFQRTDLLTQVAMEIEKQVKTKCQQTADMVVNCIIPTSQDDLKPNKPTLVLCSNASRLGTAVSMALNNIQCSPDVVVIVLHHKAKHALPNQSSDRVLMSPEYKQLGGIFDMAFLPEQGIYHCDMNEIALKKIFEFLKYRIFQKERLQ